MKHIIASTINYIPASHESELDPGVLKKVLLHESELQIGKVQMVNWASLLPNKSFVSHFHEDMQEIFIMLDGGIIATVNEAEVLLDKGDVIIIEAKEVHKLTNPTSRSIDYIVLGISSKK